jgi:hypothetical protein
MGIGTNEVLMRDIHMEIPKVHIRKKWWPAEKNGVGPSHDWRENITKNTGAGMLRLRPWIWEILDSVGMWQSILPHARKWAVRLCSG